MGGVSSTEGESGPKPVAVPYTRGLGSAVFQAVLVIVGVLLGFAATEWRETQVEKQNADRALAGIIEEMKANTAAVMAARAYHGERLALIAGAMKAGETLTLAAFDRGFIAPAQLSESAWTSAGEVGALQHIPFVKVLILGQVYDQQRAYTMQQQALSQVIYRELFDTGAQGVAENAGGLRSLITTLTYRENQLAEAYAKAMSEASAKP